MGALSEIAEINQHTYYSAFFIVHIVFLLIFCNAGRADILVYDGIIGVAEFPDIELPYTQSIRRNGIEGVLVVANPLHACVNISRPPYTNESTNWFVLMSGNFCTFETKVHNARFAGYTLGIIYTYKARVENFSNLRHYRFYSDMPTVVVKTEDGLRMKENYLYDDIMRYRLIVFPNNSFSIMTFLLLFSIVAGLFLVIMLAFTVIRFFQQSSTVHNGRLSSQHLRQLQTTTYQKGDHYETCAICLEDYKDQDKLRILPCSHGYHMKCIDPWLTNNRRICPVCKRKVLMGSESSSSHVNQNFEEESERTPLLQGSRVGPRGAYSYSTPFPVINTPHINLSTGQTVASVHSTPDASLRPERHSDEQNIHSTSDASVQPDEQSASSIFDTSVQPEKHPDDQNVHPMSAASLQPDQQSVSITSGASLQPDGQNVLSTSDLSVQPDSLTGQNVLNSQQI